MFYKIEHPNCWGKSPMKMRYFEFKVPPNNILKIFRNRLFELKKTFSIFRRYS